MTFVDVILPLPLAGLFTYAVPVAWERQVACGIRVLVPFGRNKTYLAIVAKVHHTQPSDYQVKEVLQLVDRQPILLPLQYQLWQWIADYYLSPIGEVYNAALPAGLKVEEGYRPKTELFIRLTPQFQNEQALRVALQVLGRAPKQLEAFVEYLALSHHW